MRLDAERSAWIRSCDQRRFGESESVVSGDGIWALDLGGRRTALGAVQGEQTSLLWQCGDIAVQARDNDLVLATHGRGIWIVDDISAFRALTPDVLSKEATLVPGRTIQYLETSGGWADGDESFTGRSKQTDAQITYYQKSRHIFGDLKIEIIDQNGKVVDTIPGSKHRGLNRANWSMRVKAPAVPPAATALFEATQGPRVLPGTYTIKMTKGDNVYTEKMNIVLDPRVKFTVEDRKAQFDLTMKVYHTIEHMTYAVEAIEGVRNGANARMAKLSEKDPLRKQLQDLAAQCDTLRGKIVATKEGGMITGEERIRELLGQLYGTVNGYEGKPSDYQAARADSLAHELEDVMGEFQKLTQKEPSGSECRAEEKEGRSYLRC